MKYVPSIVVGQLSKSAGSTTASRNRFGSYFRNRVNPMLVQNAATAAVRSSLATLSSNWRGLTEAQRTAWGILGTGITRTDSLGQTYTLTGLQAYCSVNRNLTTYGSAFVSDAPAYTPPAALLTVTLTATSV